MYELNDTIVAVGSPSGDKRVIIRISGPDTSDMLRRIFSPPVPGDRSCILSGSIAVNDELRIDAELYLFCAPHSYTGESLAEIHTDSNPPVTEVLLSRLVSGGSRRLAGPGEFTARAYLNGRIDLARAEAVNEVISSSNRLQLAAAERLLAGRLAETAAEIRLAVMDCLGLIEAGMDFSGEDIEFITRAEAEQRLVGIKGCLEGLLADSVGYESLIDLPAVGIAGAPGAGKSSLLNRLLGRQRSIVSEQHRTTRDVLTGLLRLSRCECVLFDCAGLILSPKGILDELAQAAAVDSLQKASAVIFCVDISKTNRDGDVEVYELVRPQDLIAVATKADLPDENLLTKRIGELKKLFGVDFIVTSAKTGTGMELLRSAVDRKIIELTGGSDVRFAEGPEAAVVLTARHKQAITEAIGDISDSVVELKGGNDEVAAMMLRAAYRAISDIERQHIDEQILESIFSRFCIGK